MAVTYIPPEFFGISGLGKSLSNIGEQQREDEETRHRREREDLADRLAVESAAIDRFKAINTLAEQSPGDQGLALRQHALDGLASAGMVPTDVRLELTPEDINANQNTLALATPANVRTDEQWIRVGNYMNLPPGYTPADARMTVENSLRQQGFDLTKLQEDEAAREEYRTYLEGRGQSPGQIQAQMGIYGVADLRAGTSLKDAQAENELAQGRLADARAEALLGTGASEVATARLRLLEPFFDVMAKNGVDARVAYKLANDQELTPEEEGSIASALASAARSASDVQDRMRVLADLLKVQHLGEGTHALAIVGIASELFGADVVTATPKKGWFGREKEGYEISVNLELALSRLLSEDGRTGGIRGDTEEIVAAMREQVQSISTKEELDVAVADAEALQDHPIKPIILQLLQERAQELDSVAQGPAEVHPMASSDVASMSERDVRLELARLQVDLNDAVDAHNLDEITRIRQRMVELNRALSERVHR